MTTARDLEGWRIDKGNLVDGTDGYTLDRYIKLTRPGDWWIILKRVLLVIRARMWRMTGARSGHYMVVHHADDYIFMPVPTNTKVLGWRTGNKYIRR